jgi:hypothetical protein
MEVAPYVTQLEGHKTKMRRERAERSRERERTQSDEARERQIHVLVR